MLVVPGHINIFSLVRLQKIKVDKSDLIFSLQKLQVSSRKMNFRF